MASEEQAPAQATNSASTEYEKARSTKFKFKSKSSRRSKHHSTSGDDSSHSHRKPKRRRRDHSPTSKKPRYRAPLDDDPSTYDDAHARWATADEATSGLDPTTAFRESLFDALADDEGAAFWEGVYGQPIHVYPSTKQTGPDGELERMNEDEYAEHVRRRMWEKSHEHILEERAKREKERRRRREAEARAWREDGDKDEQGAWGREKAAFEARIEESLRKGGERREGKRWREAWARYIAGWERFAEVVAEKEGGALAGGKAARGIIPWPVESGKWKDVSGKEDVDEFFRSAVPADTDLAAVLKAERVRWHPDKMQQRFGANKLDEETVRTITAVFQVVDSIWGDVRNRKK